MPLDTQMDIFLHIPKTGGTTLATTLRWVYTPWACARLANAWNARADSANGNTLEAGVEAELAMGHVRYGVHRNHDGPHRYFTILRCPERRYLSRYYHLKMQYVKMQYASSHREMTLASYCRSDHPWAGANEMTHYVSGVDPSEAPQTALDTAKEHLVEKIATFGVLEQFDESLLLLHRRLGWPRLPFYTSSNERPSRPVLEDLSEELVALVRHQNRLDAELYDFAQQQFERQLEETFGDLPAARRSFRKKNDAIQPLASALIGAYRTGRALLHRLRF